MRWWYFIPLLVFMLSDDELVCIGDVINGGEALVAMPPHAELSPNYYDTVSFYVEGRGKTELHIREDYNSTWFTTDIDTLIGEDWTRLMYEPIRRLGDDDTFGSALIYDNTDITSVFNNRDAISKQTKWMLCVEDTDIMYLGPAIVEAVQLDSDRTMERIVQAIEGWHHTYMIYDSTETGWWFAGQFTVIDQSDFAEPDLSLPGFIGVQSPFHGTFVSGTDVVFFNLSDKGVEFCFVISKSFSQGNLEDIGDTFITMDSKADLSVLMRKRIYVVEHININFSTPANNDPEQRLYSEDVAFTLIDTGNNSYVPKKVNMGFKQFCDGEPCDPDYFFPELYAYQKLAYLKAHGNISTRNLLANFVYDSTAYFR